MNLQPCPFCNGTILSLEMLVPIWGNRAEELHVICDDCAISVPYYVWNKRKKEMNNNKLEIHELKPM